MIGTIINTHDYWCFKNIITRSSVTWEKPKIWTARSPAPGFEAPTITFIHFPAQPFPWSFFTMTISWRSVLSSYFKIYLFLLGFRPETPPVHPCLLPPREASSFRSSLRTDREFGRLRVSSYVNLWLSWGVVLVLGNWWWLVWRFSRSPGWRVIIWLSRWVRCVLGDARVLCQVLIWVWPHHLFMIFDVRRIAWNVLLFQISNLSEGSCCLVHLNGEWVTLGAWLGV